MELWARLGLDPVQHRTIALVGAGGKTTLLYALAHEARTAGLPVIVTTTTRMFPHPRLHVTEAPGDVLTHGIVQLGRVGANGKLCGVGKLKESAAAAVTLVEADGSRGLPLKLPSEREPVIPPESNAVLGVAGLSAVGRPIREVCHRPELVCRFLDKAEDDLVTGEDVMRILAQQKGVLPHMTYVAVLNQGDLRPANGIVTSFSEKERGGLCWF